jgi:hypothetical protein
MLSTKLRTASYYLEEIMDRRREDHRDRWCPC